MRCVSSGRRVTRRSARTTGMPMEIFGTKRPSITSTWRRSAPAASAAATSSPSRAKSAARIEGARRMVEAAAFGFALVRPRMVRPRFVVTALRRQSPCRRSASPAMVSTRMATDEELMRLGAHAAALVADGARIGLGSGRAAATFVQALGARVREGLAVSGIPTSEATAALGRQVGIALSTLDDGPLDLTVDGADEVDPELDLIKGYGGPPPRAGHRAGRSPPPVHTGTTAGRWR